VKVQDDVAYNYFSFCGKTFVTFENKRNIKGKKRKKKERKKE
jgi:hypothetical protein